MIEQGRYRRHPGSGDAESRTHTSTLRAAGHGRGLRHIVRTMSKANVEIVRRANAALNANDIEGLFGFFDSEFEFVDHMGAVGEESGSGIETFRRQAESWFEVFPNFRADTEEFIDAGDRVVCVTQWRGSGAASGLEYHQLAAEVYTLRDGKIVHAELGFADRAAAVQAAAI
jgi:ketosteroid isomerase-like protein